MEYLRTLVQRASLIPFFFLLPHACLAQDNTEKTAPYTLLVGVDQRQTISLNGPWHYLVEQPPARELYNSKGLVRDDGWAHNTKPNLTGQHNGEYNFQTAPTMRIPGDWNTQDLTLFHFEGVVWFERSFRYVPESGKRAFIHIGAANYRAVMWVNGQRICEHEGGFTPFDCEITDAVQRDGANRVTIAVDSTRRKDGIPSDNFDWFNYGGITRDVSLVVLPAEFIDDYDIHLRREPLFEKSAARTLEGYVHVVGAMAGTHVSVRIRSAGVSLDLTTDSSGRAAFTSVVESLKLWSPLVPTLYSVEMKTSRDQLIDHIGFRDVRVDGTRILLNGVPIFLKGANVQEEAPVRGGSISRDADVRNVFSMLQTLNGNFLRLAHAPYDERMERYADVHGILIWSEIPVWQHIEFENPAVYEKAAAMLHEMIRRDRNKASVIFWSISNETPNTSKRTAFLARLAMEARESDSTRLITSALVDPMSQSDEVQLTDPLIQFLDVVGQNEYIGWYEGLPQDADRKTWMLPVPKPLIFSEFGAGAKYGNHGSSFARWTEEEQANVYIHQFRMMRKISFLAGVAPWVLMDFRSPMRNLPRIQNGYNRKGLFSEKMQSKKATQVVQNTYRRGTLADFDVSP